jgi:hypothetical protein
MFTINVEKDELVNQFPEIKKWVKKIQKMSFSNKKEINDSEIEFYCSYGYFVPKSFNGDKYAEISEATSKMLFDERLNFELSKVRVNLTMKIGHFVISDRLPKGVVPESVVRIVTEVTKVKMMVESEFYQNEEVKKSIPEIDKTYVDIEIVKDVVTNDYKENKNFDIDSILDKISENGLDSLSEEEKNFLDNKSKGL